MKLLIASDIHGSALYANTIKTAFQIHQCDKLLLLGDLLYHGPRNPLPIQYDPNAVTVTLNSLKEHIIAVRGNCDSEVDQMVLDFSIMSDYKTIKMNHFTVFASHGHIYSPEHLPHLQKGDVFVFGHIHVPVMEKKDDVYILNPGSITLPKENSAHSYIVLDEDIITYYDDTHSKITKSTSLSSL